MKGYRFITDDDTSKFCHRVTEALSNGRILHGNPKMIFDQKRGLMRCGQAVVKNSPKKNYSIFTIKIKGCIAKCLRLCSMNQAIIQL